MPGVLGGADPSCATCPLHTLCTFKTEEQPTRSSSPASFQATGETGSRRGSDLCKVMFSSHLVESWPCMATTSFLLCHYACYFSLRFKLKQMQLKLYTQTHERTHTHTGKGRGDTCFMENGSLQFLVVGYHEATGQDRPGMGVFRMH